MKLDAAGWNSSQGQEGVGVGPLRHYFTAIRPLQTDQKDRSIKIYIQVMVPQPYHMCTTDVPWYSYGVAMAHLWYHNPHVIRGGAPFTS